MGGVDLRGGRDEAMNEGMQRATWVCMKRYSSIKGHHVDSWLGSLGLPISPQKKEKRNQREGKEPTITNKRKKKGGRQSELGQGEKP